MKMKFFSTNKSEPAFSGKINKFWRNQNKFFPVVKMQTNGGQIIIIAALFSLFISTAIVSAISSPVVSQLKISRDLSKSKQGFFTAESGNEDVIYRIKNNMIVSSNESLSLGLGTAVTTVNDISSEEKEVVTIGDWDSRIRKVRSKIKVSSGVSFNYGLFVGQGGIDFDNNATINGSIYSNGSIEGAAGVIIAGDAYVAAQLATTSEKEWITKNDDFIVGRYVSGLPQIDAVQSFKSSSSDVYLTKVDLYLKKVGNPANLSVKITNDKSSSPDKNSVIASGSVSSNLIGNGYSFVEVSFDNNPQLESTKTYWIVVDLNDDNSNYYVWGLDNTDAYVDGTGKYGTDWKSSLNAIGGDLNFKVWASSEESTGSLSDVTLTDGLGGEFIAHAHSVTDVNTDGNVFAHVVNGGTIGGDVIADTILNCTVLGDANYNTSTCVVSGVEISPTVVPTDPPYLSMPISEANIDSWKADALLGGTISAGDFSPSNGEVVGPGVIDGDLIIGNGRTMELGGTIYVKGNVVVENNANLTLGVAYGADGSGVIVSDGWISTELNVLINSPRTNNGHLMLLSLSVCDGETTFVPECSASEAASIVVLNSTEGDILAAPYGTIVMKQNVSAVSLLANKLKLNENIVLDYEQGLTNMNFSSGPSATWSLESWREIE